MKIPDFEKYEVFNVAGPKAPKLSYAKLLKRGPIRENSRSVVVVEFWATWCGPCKQTIPILSQAQALYKSKNVAIIGISNEENQSTLANYVTNMGSSMNYSVGFDPQNKTVGPYSSIWNIGTIPHA